MILVLCLPSAFGRRKKEKAGTCEDDLYRDTQYGFQFKLDDGWKFKIGDDDDNLRLTLVQKNYQVPPDYLDAEDYTQVPRIVVWAGETPLGAAAFLDSLLSETYKSEQKNDIFKEFEIINASAAGSGTYREELVPKGKRSLDLAGETAVHWKGYVPYMKEVSESATSIGGKRVRGAYGGAIVAVKKGKVVVLFHLICEWLYFPEVENEALGMITSLQWPPAQPEG
jgi:hypothetical protein